LLARSARSISSASRSLFFDELDVAPIRRDPAVGLLLERMESVDAAREPHRVDSPVRIPLERLHHLEHASSLETAQRLRCGRLPAELREVQGVPHLAPDLVRERADVVERGADPEELAPLQLR